MARGHRFPVHVAWEGGRLTTAHVDGKAPLSIATPPEFRGTNPDVWSPEDVFVAAAAPCLAVTIESLAEQHDVVLVDLDVRAVGVVGRRPDGRFGFVRIEQSVEAEVAEGGEDAARAAIAKAEETCLVSVSLDLPVETEVTLRATAASTPG